MRLLAGAVLFVYLSLQSSYQITCLLSILLKLFTLPYHMYVYIYIYLVYVCCVCMCFWLCPSCSIVMVVVNNNVWLTPQNQRQRQSRPPGMSPPTWRLTRSNSLTQCIGAANEMHIYSTYLGGWHDALSPFASENVYVSTRKYVTWIYNVLHTYSQRLVWWTSNV